jgi:hypothetical protein
MRKREERREMRCDVMDWREEAGAFFFLSLSLSLFCLYLPDNGSTRQAAAVGQVHHEVLVHVLLPGHAGWLRRGERGKSKRRVERRSAGGERVESIPSCFLVNRWGKKSGMSVHTAAGEVLYDTCACVRREGVRVRRPRGGRGSELAELRKESNGRALAFRPRVGPPLPSSRLG